MKHLTALFFLSATCIAQAQSPYIHKVYDYRPAPGQFVNDIPTYTSGDTQEDMNRKVEAAIAGANHYKSMVTLGGYGGYVVFGFDHPVENIPGKYDFRILANAFYADNNPNCESSYEGGSCEPGIVMVSRDVNKNGLPDDPWYELAGSDYHSPKTIRNYRITYYRPDENKKWEPDPDNPSIVDTTYIRWTTDGYGDGYLYRNSYHTQPYYPQWIDEDELVFEGAKLADNYVDESGQGKYFVLYASHWGYVDNQPNADARSAFSIDWAVDAAGNSVSLPEIDFVKVYTAVNQYCGWLGETSTEISGAIDLHLTGGDADVPVFTTGIGINRQTAELQPGETLTLSATVAPANATNKAVTWKTCDTNVVAVTQTGLVTARADGSTTVQAVAKDGCYIAGCLITVKTPVPEPEPEPTPEPTPNPTPEPTPDPDPDDVPTPAPNPDPDTDPDPQQPSAVTGIALSPATLVLPPNGSALLTVSVKPVNAENRAVWWKSSDRSVAEVNGNGAVKAIAVGTASITATTVEGGFSAACLLTVVRPSVMQPPAGAQPQAFYADGALHLYNMAGCECSLRNIGGQTVKVFRPASDHEIVECRVARGVYLLNKTKIVIND